MLRGPVLANWTEGRISNDLPVEHFPIHRETSGRLILVIASWLSRLLSRLRLNFSRKPFRVRSYVTAMTAQCFDVIADNQKIAAIYESLSAS
jgi:hypothetical protein